MVRTVEKEKIRHNKIYIENCCKCTLSFSFLFSFFFSYYCRLIVEKTFIKRIVLVIPHCFMWLIRSGKMNDTRRISIMFYKFYFFFTLVEKKRSIVNMRLRGEEVRNIDNENVKEKQSSANGVSTKPDTLNERRRRREELKGVLRFTFPRSLRSSGELYAFLVRWFPAFAFMSSACVCAPSS